MLNHSLVTRAKQQIAMVREPIFWLPIFEPGGAPLTKETGARFGDALTKLRSGMSQAKFDAAMAAIDLRGAFFREMEALGIEGYVGLSYAINSGDPRANWFTKDPAWRLP